MCSVRAAGTGIGVFRGRRVPTERLEAQGQISSFWGRYDARHPFYYGGAGVAGGKAIGHRTTVDNRPRFSHRLQALMCSVLARRSIAGAEGLPEWRARTGIRMTITDCLGYCKTGPIIWTEPAGRLLQMGTPHDLVSIVQEPEEARHDR